MSAEPGRDRPNPDPTVKTKPDQDPIIKTALSAVLLVVRFLDPGPDPDPILPVTTDFLYLIYIHMGSRKKSSFFLVAWLLRGKGEGPGH